MKQLQKYDTKQSQIEYTGYVARHTIQVCDG